MFASRQIARALLCGPLLQDVQLSPGLMGSHPAVKGVVATAGIDPVGAGGFKRAMQVCDDTL